jgi:hypothetical protein
MGPYSTPNLSSCVFFEGICPSVPHSCYPGKALASETSGKWNTENIMDAYKTTTLYLQNKFSFFKRNISIVGAGK